MTRNGKKIMKYNPTKHLLMEKIPNMFIDSHPIQVDILELDTGSLVGAGSQTLQWFVTQVNVWLNYVTSVTETHFTTSDVVTKKAAFFYDAEYGPTEWYMSFDPEIDDKYKHLVHYIHV